MKLSVAGIGSSVDGDLGRGGSALWRRFTGFHAFCSCEKRAAIRRDKCQTYKMAVATAAIS